MLSAISLPVQGQPCPSFSILLKLLTLPATSKRMPHFLPHKEIEVVRKPQIPILRPEAHLHPVATPPSLLLGRGVSPSSHCPIRPLPASWGPGSTHLPSLPESSVDHAPIFPLSPPPFLSQASIRNSNLPPPLPHLLVFPQVTEVRLPLRQLPRNCSKLPLTVKCRPSALSSFLAPLPSLQALVFFYPDD